MLQCPTLEIWYPRLWKAYIVQICTPYKYTSVKAGLRVTPQTHDSQRLKPIHYDGTLAVFHRDVEGSGTSQHLEQYLDS